MRPIRTNKSAMAPRSSREIIRLTFGRNKKPSAEAIVQTYPSMTIPTENKAIEALPASIPSRLGVMFRTKRWATSVTVLHDVKLKMSL